MYESFVQDARARYAILKEAVGLTRAWTSDDPARCVGGREDGERGETRREGPNPYRPLDTISMHAHQCTNRCVSYCAERWCRRTARQALLRKEVIQPHLPVRLPCYDFTPITDPTFDGSLPKGWATGFGCCRLSWCDGRCVQGPGTYSPRRADPGLLATPASWSRVADSNPN